MLAPTAERRTGQAAPTPIPRVIGNATAKEIAPVVDNACMIPIEADALCKIAVKIIPIKIARKGLFTLSIIFKKVGLVLNPDTEPLIVCIPVIRIANPIIIAPTFFNDSFFTKVLKIIPITATTAAIVVEEINVATPLPPSMYERHKIHPVIDVPMLAPIIVPIA